MSSGSGELSNGDYYRGVEGSNYFLRAYTPTKVSKAGDSSPIEYGIFFTTPDSPFGGAVYCIGKGSTVSQTAKGDVVWDLKHVTKLRVCDGKGNNSATVCL